MRRFSLPGRNRGGSPCRPFERSSIDRQADHRGEQGYLLATSGILILVLVALLSTYSFVLKRDASYKANYAAGERFAVVTAAAHFYAQQQVYDAGGSVNGCALLPAMGMPDGGDKIGAINGTHFDIEVCGAASAPIVTPVHPAASAYVHLKIRNPTGRLPSDTVAFLAGASAHGMGRVGIYGQNAGGACGAGIAALRWGPEPNACLSDGDINMLGIVDVQDGDIIVPAWETALADAQNAVIYRYPQPERADMNAMTVDLQFNRATPLPAGPLNCAAAHPDYNCLRGAGGIITVENDPTQPDIDAPGYVTVHGNGATPGELVVRQGSPATLSGNTVTNDSLRVYDQGGATNVMTVAGTANFSVGATPGHLNVGGKLSPPAGIPNTINVASATDVETNIIGAKVADGETRYNTTVNLSGGAPQAKFQSMGATILSNTATPPQPALQMTKNGGRLASVSGAIGAPTGQDFRDIGGGHLEIYAANITTTGTTAHIQTTNDPTWSVGSIDQRGSSPNAKELRVKSLELQDCIGRACPNSINANPGGGF